MTDEIKRLYRIIDGLIEGNRFDPTLDYPKVVVDLKNSNLNENEKLVYLRFENGLYGVKVKKDINNKEIIKRFRLLFDHIDDEDFKKKGTLDYNSSYN